jgi:serine/threonine-protein kinase
MIAGSPSEKISYGEYIMDQFREGQVIDERYTVVRRLGRGGMGEVYLVEDAESGEQRALKTLRSKYLNSNHAKARFIREATTARQLTHPGIVGIYSAGQWEGILYYTMDYVEGKSLRQWMHQRGRLDIGSTVRILCLVADALAHAHRMTIHRDLSPENVMVLGDGSIRILDFGLAKVDDKFKNLTMLGINLGKIAYIAPEQHQDASRVDKRADIYPLGVMFFEMLTGRRPELGDKISRICPGLPREADVFLSKAMARNPIDRFPSVQVFQSELLALYQRIRDWEIKRKTLHMRLWLAIVNFFDKIRIRKVL